MPDLPADSLNQVIRMVVGNYKSSRSRRIKLSSPLRMTHPFIQLTRATCSAMTANAVKMLSATKGKKVWNTLLVYPKFAELAAKYPMAHPRMFERNDNIYLSIPFEVAGKQESDETCLGIDLGLRRLATTSDGMAYTDKAYLSRRRKLRYLKRCLQHKKKQSITANRHLDRLKRKEKNLSKDFCHGLVNRLLDTDKTILVVEDLRQLKQETSRKVIIKKDGTALNVRRSSHNNRLGQFPFYRLYTILAYKAPLAGKRVETVSPRYTSQIDCRTGRMVGTRKGCRFYGDDGVVLDADWNAAINIVDRYTKHPLSTIRAPIDGTLLVLGGRVHSTTRTLGESHRAILHHCGKGS